MSGILGKKLGMTRIFQEDGHVIPITVVQCEPNTVVQIKTIEKDGYPAIVLGFLKRKKQTKTKKFYHLKEFRVEDPSKYTKGAEVTVKDFEGVEEVAKVTAVSKGKGYQGVIKRHHFSRGPETHGSHHHREPGSIGARAKPGRVEVGKEMPGQMGFDQVTIKHIKIAHLDTAQNLIGLRGAVPGPIGGLVIIQK